jgi:hypothetical protein
MNGKKKLIQIHSVNGDGGAIYKCGVFFFFDIKIQKRKNVFLYKNQVIKSTMYQIEID